MRSRLTSSLVLGLTVALVGGCACGDRCRIPLLQKFGHRLSRKTSVSDDNLLENRVIDCECDTPVGSDEIWYTDDSTETDPDVEFLDFTEPPEDAPQANPPALELPEIPEPPSIELKPDDESDELPELKRADPPKDDSGFHSPVGLPRVQSVVEAPFVREVDQPINAAPGQADEPPLSLLESVPNLQCQTDIALAEQELRSLDQDHSDNQDVSVLITDTIRIKAVPISTSKKAIKPRRLEKSRPQSNGNDVEVDKFQRETLPAKTFDTTVPAPIVLRAVPSGNHVVIDHRVADARAGSRFGLSSGQRDETVAEDHDSESETSANGKNLNSDQVPQFHALPSLEPGPDGFTKSTSYQVPMENDASVLLDVSSAIDCGLIDQNGYYDRQQHWTHLQNSILKIVDPKNPLEQLQILRMQAATPLDRQTQVPPIVSIRSVMDPVIVRGVYPEANLPIANHESTIPMIHARTNYGEDRLEASIRGLSARPKTEPSRPNTIDR